MRNNNRTYEVVVRIKKSPIEFSDGVHFHRYSIGKEWRMYHIEARDQKKASQKAAKHGYPISVRKVDMSSIVGNIEKLQLNQPVNPYENAISMDEMLWQKRNKRINNKGKDKHGY